ncbi:hypothetical protein Q8A67_018021 [Cirrhinus molitorella]|uniref:Uncharacterized protein n=1 Tax=Cirrhinus molitorella TaxID=172907 RepID=A0AA88TGZ6_9TELE|nr:hypothetical protein Q8A67_018021 [Cirrhinus molitorella]
MLEEETARGRGAGGVEEKEEEDAVGRGLVVQTLISETLFTGLEKPTSVAPSTRLGPDNRTPATGNEKEGEREQECLVYVHAKHAFSQDSFSITPQPCAVLDKGPDPSPLQLISSPPILLSTHLWIGSNHDWGK